MRQRSGRACPFRKLYQDVMVVQPDRIRMATMAPVRWTAREAARRRGRRGRRSVSVARTRSKVAA